MLLRISPGRVIKHTLEVLMGLRGEMDGGSLVSPGFESFTMST